MFYNFFMSGAEKKQLLGHEAVTTKNTNLYFMRAQKMVHEETYECWKVDDWAPKRSLSLSSVETSFNFFLSPREALRLIHIFAFALLFALIRIG